MCCLPGSIPSLGRRSRAALVSGRKSDRHSPLFLVVFVELTEDDDDDELNTNPPAPPIEQSTPGFANSRVRALPHVHPRGLGSRPSSLRGLNEEFYLKKVKNKKSYGAWKIEKAIFHIEYLVRTAL